MIDAQATATWTLPDGTVVTYAVLKPRPTLNGVRTVAVRPGERLDLLASEVLGDPLAAAAICDANRALNPFDLLPEHTIVQIPGVDLG